MAPTRRIKAAASTRTSSASQAAAVDVEPDEDMDSDNAAYHPHRSTPYSRQNSASLLSGAYPLQRGTACLSCRKRKMKCDGSKPVCHQCTKANRMADCEYDDGKSKTRTQLLQEKIQRLETKLHDLETTNPGNQTDKDSGIALSLPVASTSTFMNNNGTSFSNPSPPFDLLLDPSNDGLLSFDFRQASRPTTSSESLGLDPLQLRHVIDVASSSAGDSAAAWNSILGAAPVPVVDSNTLNSDWRQEDVSPALRQTLLEIVIPHLPQLGIDIHVPTFLQALQLPATHPLCPHPSLLNALYLHACSLSSPDHYLFAYQSRFLQRARDAVHTSLQNADRIIDTLRAQCLIAGWYFKSGRTLEGYAIVCATARFAVGCELNRVVSPVWKTPRTPEIPSNLETGSSPSGLGIGLPGLSATVAAGGGLGNLGDDTTQNISLQQLNNPRTITLGFGTGIIPPSSFPSVWLHPSAKSMAMGPRLGGYGPLSGNGRNNPILDPPRSARELGERILTFWRVFNLDRFWSVVCGLQPALTEDEIMTVWPRSMEDYESGNVNDAEYASVRSLGIRQTTANSRPDTPAALLSKSIALFERSARLAASLSSTQPPTDAFWVAFRLMEDSIAQMTTAVPSYKRRVVSTLDPLGIMNGSGSRPGSVHGVAGGSRRQSPSGDGNSPTQGSQTFTVDHTLVLIHILLKSAAVQLHNIFAREDATSYQKAFTAAKSGAQIIAEVAEVIGESGDSLHVMLGPCLTLFADILIREGVRRSALVNTIEPELDAILFVLRAIGIKAPLVRRQALLVEAAKHAVIAQAQQLQQHAVQQQPVQVQLQSIMPFEAGLA